MAFDGLLCDEKTVAVVCNQFGDTGKGKFIDYLAKWAEIVARGTGGANAGHTIVLPNGTSFVVHLIPSSIAHDAEGVTSIIGNGVAFDPVAFSRELDASMRLGLSADHLFVAYNARLVLPHHLVLDRIMDKGDGGVKLGTTGKGIGPVYADHVARHGFFVNDLFNRDVFASKLRERLGDVRRALAHVDSGLVKKVMSHPDLCDGAFFHSRDVFDTDAIVAAYTSGSLHDSLVGRVRDTDAMLREAVGRKNVLLEGAQGLLLSIDYGTYPFVTSSDCSVHGLARGVGLSSSSVDLTLGVTKGLYMTRVGEGPFPTELGGQQSAVWCRERKRVDEEALYPSVDVNAADPFERGIALRRVGAEYGATTGRPRRTGELDLPLLRYAASVNGPELVMTKLDVLDDCHQIPVCVAYSYNGPDYVYAGRTIHHGDRLDVAVPDSFVLSHCVPISVSFDGWMTSTKNISSYTDLPRELHNLVSFVEKQTGTHVRLVSVGPERDRTLVKQY